MARTKRLGPASLGEDSDHRVQRWVSEEASPESSGDVVALSSDASDSDGSGSSSDSLARLSPLSGAPSSSEEASCSSSEYVGAKDDDVELPQPPVQLVVSAARNAELSSVLEHPSRHGSARGRLERRDVEASLPPLPVEDDLPVMDVPTLHHRVTELENKLAVDNRSITSLSEERQGALDDREEDVREASKLQAKVHALRRKGDGASTSQTPPPVVPSSILELQTKAKERVHIIEQRVREIEEKLREASAGLQ